MNADDARFCTITQEVRGGDGMIILTSAHPPTNPDTDHTWHLMYCSSHVASAALQGSSQTELKAWQEGVDWVELATRWKPFRLLPYPHQRNLPTEGMLDRHALSMLGRTLLYHLQCSMFWWCTCGKCLWAANVCVTMQCAYTTFRNYKLNYFSPKAQKGA